jgi:NADPH:quinone reductase-like Zn-dependent oxidoreductase
MANVRLVKPAYDRENLTALLELLETGKVRVVVDQAYPLDHAASAVAHMLGHHARGKIVITA